MKTKSLFPFHQPACVCCCVHSIMGRHARSIITGVLVAWLHTQGERLIKHHQVTLTQVDSILNEVCYDRDETSIESLGLVT